MASKFSMSDLGKLSYYLGIEVDQKSDGIYLKQERYARKIIKEAGMHESNPTKIPLEPGTVLTKAEDEAVIEATGYRKLIGCMRYLVHTRPDLSYSVGVLSRYMHEPRTSHGQAIKQVMRYIKGTLNFGVKYFRDGKVNIVGYSDSSYNMDRDDGRSITGHIYYLGRSPITWCSQKQDTVALSSCEAEYMAGTAATCQGIWLRELLAVVTGWEEQKVALYLDNKSAIALSRNHVFHGKSKHIHARFHFIRECVEKDKVEVEYVPGDDQLADILTKPLARVKFSEMRRRMGVQGLLKFDSEIKGVNVD